MRPGVMVRHAKIVLVLELTDYTVEEYQQIEDAIVDLEYRGFVDESTGERSVASLRWRID